MPTATGSDTRFTYDDFLLFPDDGKRHEIIDGEHYVTPSPNTRHQKLVGRLHLALGNFLEAHPEHGQVFLAPFDVVFSFYDVVEPDLVFVAGDQLEILTDKNIQGTPALVVEILSKGTRKRDELIKRRLFGAILSSHQASRCNPPTNGCSHHQARTEASHPPPPSLRRDKPPHPRTLALRTSHFAPI